MLVANGCMFGSSEKQVNTEIMFENPVLQHSIAETKKMIIIIVTLIIILLHNCNHIIIQFFNQSTQMYTVH